MYKDRNQGSDTEEEEEPGYVLRALQDIDVTFVISG
jgi:hypothetical protein